MAAARPSPLTFLALPPEIRTLISDMGAGIEMTSTSEALYFVMV